MNTKVTYEQLTDSQLISLIISEKKDEAVTDNLLSKYSSLSTLLMESDENELIKLCGIGLKRAKILKAVAELSKRLSKASVPGAKVTSPAEAAALLMSEMRFLKKEHMNTILLNTKCHVIDIENISIGSLNSSIVHPREVFLTAIRRSSSSIVMVHNHPSGDPTPSVDDINITKRVFEAGKVIGIELVDHIIIGAGVFRSLKELNLF